MLKELPWEISLFYFIINPMNNAHFYIFMSCISGVPDHAVCVAKGNAAQLAWNWCWNQQSPWSLTCFLKGWPPILPHLVLPHLGLLSLILPTKYCYKMAGYYLASFNSSRQHTVSAADRGGGNRGSFPRAPTVRGPPNSFRLVQIKYIRQSHSSLAS